MSDEDIEIDAADYNTNYKGQFSQYLVLPQWADIRTTSLLTMYQSEPPRGQQKERDKTSIMVDGKKSFMLHNK